MSQVRPFALHAGDLIVVDFAGATGNKRRPAVIVSSDLYHATRPDTILGLITTQIAKAADPTDVLLTDWSLAGLKQPSAFRAFLVTLPQSKIVAHIGRLSATDWQAVRNRLATALVL